MSQSLCNRVEAIRVFAEEAFMNAIKTVEWVRTIEKRVIVDGKSP